MGDDFELASPTHLQIEVTENCNHECFYCFNHWRTDDSSNNHMSLSNARRLTQIINSRIKPFKIGRAHV